MRKRVFGRKLARGGGARKALFRSLIAALVANGKIKTTKAKAKAIQGQIDKVINISKKDSVSARRRVLALLANDRETARKIFDKVSKTFPDRKSGYTRIVPLPMRRGDRAEMVRMEWVKEIAGTESKKSRKGSRKSPSSKPDIKQEKSSKKPRLKLTRNKVLKRKKGKAKRK